MKSAMLIGDSWANEALRFCLEFFTKCPATVHRFVGCTSLEIARRMAVRPAPAVDIVFIVCGVNDVVRHTGPEAYARGVMELAQWAGCKGAKVAVLEVPALLSRPKAQNLRQAFKHFIFRWWNDFGCHRVSAYYVEELRRWQRNGAVLVAFPSLPASAWHDAAHINDDGRAIVAQALTDSILPYCTWPGIALR